MLALKALCHHRLFAVKVHKQSIVWEKLLSKVDMNNSIDNLAWQLNETPVLQFYHHLATLKAAVVILLEV